MSRLKYFIACSVDLFVAGEDVANRTGGTVVGATQERMIPGARPMHPVVPR